MTKRMFSPNVRTLSVSIMLWTIHLSIAKSVSVRQQFSTLHGDEKQYYFRLLQLEEEFGAQDGPWQTSTTSIPATTTTPPPTTTKPQHEALDDETIRGAVHDWVTRTDHQPIIDVYGPIATWDVSRVQDMSKLFMHARFFDEDLSQWNTSSVTDMSYMFAFASSFRGISGLDNDGDVIGLRNWDTSRVTNMQFAFHQAIAFEGTGIIDWDVSQVTDLTYFAQGATSFHQSLWRWDTRNVQSFNRAFHNATQFTDSLCWTLHPQAVAIQTFCGTNGAHFSCDPGHTLESSINREFHNCCDCDYSTNAHYPGYHVGSDEFDDQQGTAYWNPDNDIHRVEGTSAEDTEKTTGIVLLSCIWGAVVVMIVVVVVVTLRRRQELRHWLQSKLRDPFAASPNETSVAPDGPVVATLVGRVDSGASGGPTEFDAFHGHPNNQHDSRWIVEDVIPLVTAAAAGHSQEPTSSLPIGSCPVGTSDSSVCQADAIPEQWQASNGTTIDFRQTPALATTIPYLS